MQRWQKLKQDKFIAIDYNIIINYNIQYVHLAHAIRIFVDQYIPFGHGPISIIKRQKDEGPCARVIIKELCWEILSFLTVNILTLIVFVCVVNYH